MTKRFREPVEVEVAPGAAPPDPALPDPAPPDPAPPDPAPPDPTPPDPAPPPRVLPGVPAAFRWRGRRYHVRTVLGHWREDAGYWAGPGVSVPQRDLWRVEATSGPAARHGVYELVDEQGSWRLDRVWD